jgi:Immunoglobulin I-set domain
MKSIARLLSILALCVLAGIAHGKDISQTIVLERYTLIDSDTFRYETGFLLKSGQFQVITSEIDYYSFYGLSPDDLALISGKPVMNEELYNAYHNLGGLIPTWIASPFDVTIGFVSYVVVAVKGKGDVYPAVTITTQPESDWTFLGNPAFFYVDAEPWQYLTYQWYLNSKPISGATSDSLWIDNVTKNQTGVYKCAVSSGGKPVMSQGAILTIVTPISIKKQPTSLTVKTGKKATFKVLVAGTPPFHYQWYHGKDSIAGATNALYTIAKVQASNVGDYGVVADNIHTYVGSSIVQLTVTP